MAENCPVVIWFESQMASEYWSKNWTFLDRYSNQICIPVYKSPDDGASQLTFYHLKGGFQNFWYSEGKFLVRVQPRYKLVSL